MKKLVFISLFLFSLQICFSQNQEIIDPYSGLEMELSVDHDYLIVIHIKAGSPADFSVLKPCDRIYKIGEKSVSDIHDIKSYFQNNKENILQFSINEISKTATVVNIPRVSIDLFTNKYNTECDLFNLISPCQSEYLNEMLTPKDKLNNIENIIQTSENPQAYGLQLLGEKSYYCAYWLKENRSKNTQITTLADRSKNIESFETYDFEYISKEDPLMEKTLLNDLSQELNEKGLRRDQNNPEILIFISFYSGQKDQFIPPQQIVSTRVQNYFNWYWGYIPVPVTETKTKEGYTKSIYLTNINIKFLEYKEIKNSKVPPVIWSSSYSEISGVKTFLSDCSKEIFNYMLLQFPFVVNENSENFFTNVYTYTGVIYDSDNLPVIADVIPESPAYKAGLKKGDEIVKINDRKIDENFSSSIQWRNRSHFKNALRYLFINSDFKNDNLSIFAPLKSEYEDYKNFNDKSIVFDIKRNGKKISISVKPEFKKVIFFDKSGFIID